LTARGETTGSGKRRWLPCLTSAGANVHSFLLSDPVLKEVFKADYCLTEVGGATLVDKHGKPTLTFVQVQSLPRHTGSLVLLDYCLLTLKLFVNRPTQRRECV
jgi:hypothetical protein